MMRANISTLKERGQLIQGGRWCSRKYNEEHKENIVCPGLKVAVGRFGLVQFWRRLDGEGEGVENDKEENDGFCQPGRHGVS